MIRLKYIFLYLVSTYFCTLCSIAHYASIRKVSFLIQNIAQVQKCNVFYLLNMFVKNCLHFLPENVLLYFKPL